MEFGLGQAKAKGAGWRGVPALAGAEGRGERAARAQRRRASRMATAASVASASTRSSDGGFAKRTRELEKGGVQMYAIGNDFLFEGSSGAAVEALQRYLHAEGYYASPYGFTGYFGPATKKSVKSWQRDNGVLSTGNFGNLSREKYLELQGRKQKKGAFSFLKRERRTKPAKPVVTHREVRPPSTRGKLLAPAPGVVFAISFLVVWQGLRIQRRRTSEHEFDQAERERQRAQQISRWMRTIDADRRGP